MHIPAPGSPPTPALCRSLPGCDMRSLTLSTPRPLAPPISSHDHTHTWHSSHAACAPRWTYSSLCGPHPTPSRRPHAPTLRLTPAGLLSFLHQDPLYNSDKGHCPFLRKMMHVHTARTGLRSSALPALPGPWLPACCSPPSGARGWLVLSIVPHKLLSRGPAGCPQPASLLTPTQCLWLCRPNSHLEPDPKEKCLRCITHSWGKNASKRTNSLVGHAHRAAQPTGLSVIEVNLGRCFSDCKKDGF